MDPRKQELEPYKPKNTREDLVRYAPQAGDPAPYGYGYGYDYADQPGQEGLLEYWQMLRRRKGTLIVVAFVGAVLGLLLTLPQTPVYQAKTTIEIQGFNQDFMNMREVNPVDQGSTISQQSDIQTQVKILQSESLARAVLEKLKKTRPVELGTESSRVTAWKKALNLSDTQEQPQTPEEGARAAIKNLKVRPSGQTRIVEITYDSTDPQLAADFANTLVDEYIETSLESRWQTTQRTGEWLSRQLEDMRIKLERSEDALQVYARQAGLMFVSEKESVSEEKLRQMQAELSRAEADRVARQSRYELVRTSPAETLPDVLNDASLREYQTRITDLRRQLAELSTTYTPAHARVKRVEAQIVTLESALTRERGAILERIRNEFEEAQRREKMLAANYQNQVRQVTGEAERSIQYNILKREVDSNRQLYETMLQRVKEASVASALRASNVRQVDLARAPRRPYKPQTSLYTLLGMFVGGFAGVAFVVIQSRADRSLQQPGETSLYMNVSELGVIPAAEARPALGGYYKRRKALPESQAAPSGGLERVELATWKQQQSMVSEAFRAVLTSILFSGENGDRPRVMVLTSPNPSEGKSTVASNVAIALAEVRQRVLLIDADLRKPRQHEILHLANERGLSDLLRDQEEMTGELLGSAVQPTMVPGLYAMPSGPAAASATTLLYSGRMKQLIATASEEFDAVLIDTPPMLQIPDARVLGRMSDAVILVVRAGRTSREAAQAARQRFSEDGTKVLGAVLNDWNPKKNGGYGYRYYDKYYHKSYC